MRAPGFRLHDLLAEHLESLTLCLLLSSDPFDFPDAVWRDPSLANKNIALISNLRTEVYPLVDPPVEPEHRASGARTTASAPRASRRATYTTRRRFAPYPPQDPASVAPRTPSEHSAPEEEDQPSPEEVEEVEVEVEPEDAQSSEEAPLALPEGEDFEAQGAAVTAPQPILPATPKTPTVLRGSIGSFLEPEATSVDRPRSRARAASPAAPSSSNKQLKPAAKTVFSAKVSGHYREYTYSDGSKERVFVPDIPVEKAPPSSIGPPPARPVSAPGDREVQPATPRRTSSVLAPKPPKPAPPGLGTPEERARLAVQSGKKPLLRKAPPIHSPQVFQQPHLGQRIQHSLRLRLRHCPRQSKIEGDSNSLLPKELGFTLRRP